MKIFGVVMAGGGGIRFVVLVCSKDKVQDVKKVVEELRRQRRFVVLRY